MRKFKGKYFTNSFKGLSQYSWHEWITLHCVFSSVTEDDQSQFQAFSSSASWESLKWVRYHCCRGWRQAVVYRRRKSCQFPLSRRPQWPASFGCVWARMDYLCVACVYMQWFTCRGTKTRKLFCVYAPAHTLGLMFSLRKLIKIDQNATFTFVTLWRRKKKLPLSETSFSVWFFESIFKVEQSILLFYRLLLKFYKHSLTKRIWDMYFKVQNIFRLQ